MKHLFLVSALFLSLSAFADTEMTKLDCKIDKSSNLTASGEASFLIDLDSGESTISFGVLKLYYNNGKTLSSTNTINNDNPNNEAPNFQGTVEFENDLTWGNFESEFSPKFASMELECGTDLYKKTSFKTRKGHVYSMLCRCPSAAE